MSLSRGSAAFPASSSALTPAYDVFGRHRVSLASTVTEHKQLVDESPLYYDDQLVSGSGGASTYNPLSASTTLSVDATTACRRVRQSFQRFNYIPGRGQVLFMTGALVASGSGPGNTYGFGYYDDADGIFFRDVNGETQVVIRSSVSGSPVDTAVAQSDWNLDKLDGTGPSLVTLDKTAIQIFVIDFAWLGSGPVRLGIVDQGRTIYCHSFFHANRSSVSYMRTPNLPLRFEIENDGTGAAGSLVQVCSAVQSEGDGAVVGTTRYASTEDSVISANTAGTQYVIGGLRLKTTAFSCVVKLVSVTLLVSSNNDFEWSLLLNPTIATPVTFTDVPAACVQFGPGNAGSPSSSTATGGTRLNGGYVKGSSTTGSVPHLTLESTLNIGAAIDGTRDEVYLVIRPLSANANVYGGLTWRELV